VGQLQLNDTPLGPLTPGENQFELTADLPWRNRIRLELVIDASTAIGQPNCDARLEIWA
jgi:hypothetical protein